MKPLPNLNDEAAMIKRGQRSALMSAKNEAAEALRDACTRLQSCDYGAIDEYADRADEAVIRLRAVQRLSLTLP